LIQSISPKHSLDPVSLFNASVVSNMSIPPSQINSASDVHLDGGRYAELGCSVCLV